jgi:asparagine synthase (glutamine-hydrolysing)
VSVIAGIVCRSPEPVSALDSGRLMGALRRYPADATDTWTNGSVFLGCRAQWMTPESVRETLPYYDEAHRLVIAADAILDNRKELFDRLGVEPAIREAMTDSELILRAYRRWGRAAPRYLIGDYAFAIWDENERTLFAARDLLGNRTLYYHRREGRFAFCTAIRPLLRLSGVEKELDEAWLAEFLAIPVILDTIDVHRTAYRGIGQVPPGHSVTVADGKMALEPYDAFEIPARQLKLKSNAEYEEAFRDVFREAVTCRLRTFRQVGISLSGGLDSGAVAGFAAGPLRAQGKTLRAYSYVPPPDFADWTPKWMVADESPYIRAIVRHVGNLSAHFLVLPDRDAYGEIDDLIDVMEGPYKFFENAIWIKGMLEQARQDGVGVLLSGARGNYTVSWGPALDYYARLLRTMRWVRFWRELKLYGQRVGARRARLLPVIGRMAFPWTRPRGGPPKPQLIHPEFARRTGVMDKLRGFDVGLDESAAWDEFAARDDQFRNLANANHQGTSIAKLSLRYGVWERDPTGDPRVIRFCLSLPAGQFVQNGVDRSLIRRATEGCLPDEVRLNQCVRGVQGADWIHRMKPSWPAFLGELRRLCRDPAASQYLNVPQIRESLALIGPSPRPDQAFDPHATLLMRGLIAYRFLQTMGVTAPA